MKPIAKATRSRIVRLLRAGKPVREVAETTGVSQTTVRSIRKALPSPPPVSRPAPPRVLSDRQEEDLIKRVTTWLLDAVQAQDYLLHKYGVEISVEAVRKILKRHGLKAYRRSTLLRLMEESDCPLPVDKEPEG